MDVMDGQYYSLAFRQKYPKFNGLIWAYHWLQVGLYEPLVTAHNAPERRARVDATVRRFWQMLERPPASMPYLMPMTSGVAPTFARRYPEAGAIFDNLHMMHDVISDILTSREVPRSAKRREIMRAVSVFRSDTAYGIPYETWLAMGETMGVHNMGGAAVGFAANLPQPTVERGMSMAGMEHGGMQGMQHGTAQRTPNTANTQDLQAIFNRMMADPVIRERVATDPLLQRMLASLPAGSTGGGQPAGAANMPGMQHGNMQQMPGMNMGAAPMTEAQRQAAEFITRLLADPSVEQRIHSDPDLHRIWSDPEVQRRIAELRAAQRAATQPPGQQLQPRPQQQPQQQRQPPPAPPRHQHP